MLMFNAFKSKLLHLSTGPLKVRPAVHYSVATPVSVARRSVGAVVLAVCVPLVTGADGVPAEIDASRYPTLQAALDALPEGGGLVRLPPGTFELSEPLVLRRGETRIEGSGASTHLRNVNTNGKPALIIAPLGMPAKQNARIWRVQLGNFRISGNTNSGDGIYAERVEEIFIHGLSIDHNGGNGITLTNCYEDPRVSDSIITYNSGAGLNIIASHDIVVNANHFEENQDAVRCIDSFNLCMNGNNIDDHLRHGVVIENTYGSVLSGNMIEECNGTAIVLDRDCYGITISANVIAHHLGGGVELRDAWGCAVSGNTFTLVHSNSIFVGPDSGRITITGNNFCNSYIGGGKDKRPAEHKSPMGRDEATGVVLHGASDIVVSGNSFSGLSGNAVTAFGKCCRILVCGNLMIDFGRKSQKRHAPVDLGDAIESVVKDNISGL